MSQAPLPHAPDAAALGLSMNRLIKSPLSALRASIEALTAEIGREDPHGRLLEGALQQVTRMARDVQSLVDFASPRPLAPLRCSLDEIAQSALRGLPHVLRRRVHYAHPDVRDTLVVDGPLLSSSLAHLIEGSLVRSGDDLLLQVHAAEAASCFVLVQDDGQGTFEPDAFELDGSHDEVALAVGISAARRDIERMGGTLSVQHTQRGLTCLTVEIPNRPEHGTEVAA